MPLVHETVASWMRTELRVRYPWLSAEHDDLCQTAHLKLFASLKAGQFRHRSSLRTFAATITHCVAIDLLRKRFRDRAPATTPPGSAPPSPYDQMAQSEETGLFHRALFLAPESCRALWRMDLPQLLEQLGDTNVGLSADCTRRVLDCLDEEVHRLELEVLSQLRPDPRFKLLKSIAGVGDILAPMILLETGPIERFAQVGNYSSYARCVPTNKISNGKSKGKGNAKNGNRYLAMAFVEAAHYATIWEPTIKRYYQRKCKKKPVMVANKTVANKLTRACYHMLKDGTAFDVKRAFG